MQAWNTGSVEFKEASHDKTTWADMFGKFTGLKSVRHVSLGSPHLSTVQSPRQEFDAHHFPNEATAPTASLGTRVSYRRYKNGISLSSQSHSDSEAIN